MITTPTPGGDQVDRVRIVGIDDQLVTQLARVTSSKTAIG